MYRLLVLVRVVIKIFVVSGSSACYILVFLKDEGFMTSGRYVVKVEFSADSIFPRHVYVSDLLVFFCLNYTLALEIRWLGEMFSAIFFECAVE